MDVVNTLELAKQIFPFVIASVTSGLTWDIIKAIIEKALEPVEIENRIKPPHNVAIPAIQGIAFNSDNEILQNMFYAILTKSMDKTKQNSSHPAFPQILGQVTVFEILHLYCYYHIYNHDTYSMNFELQQKCTRYYPSVNNSSTQSHLLTLGLLGERKKQFIGIESSFLEEKVDIYVSPFGKQFIEACLSPEAEKLIQELMDNA